MEILRPLLAETGAETIGKVVIGTVKGDIHDIGKNLVGMMLEGAGFEVVNLGINTDAKKSINALEQTPARHLRYVSFWLTTTMPDMKVVVDALKERGIRDKYIVLVGGAPLNEEFGKAVGADAYCRDAAVAAETARRLIDERRARCRLQVRHDGRAPRPRRRLWCAGQRARRADPATCRTSTSRACRRPCTTGPGGIPAAVRDRIRRRRKGYDRVFVAYADCGTGGLLDPVIAEEGVERLRRRALLRVLRRPRGLRAAQRERSPGTFYLTDFLARNFDRLVIGAPRARPPSRSCATTYFGNYRRLVYLAQTEDPGAGHGRPTRRPPARA